MATDVELDRAFAALTATLADQGMETFDRSRAQAIVDGALAGEPLLRVDEHGGLHDSSGLRVGVLRRLPDGSWAVERQNISADNAARDVPDG